MRRLKRVNEREGCNDIIEEGLVCIFMYTHELGGVFR